jgi:hypothetical protein
MNIERTINHPFKGFYGVLWEFQGDDMGFGGFTRPGKRLQFANWKMTIESSLIYPARKC